MAAFPIIPQDGKFIHYDIETRDYACYLDSTLIGFAPTYSAAESKINTVYYERLQDDAIVTADAAAEMDAYADEASALLHIVALEAENAALRAELAHHRFSTDFNCPRFPILMERWPSLPADYVLLYWDMDGLNACNYRYGDEGVHERARGAYAIIRQEIRIEDELYLYRGGDEFMMPLPIAHAQAVAERLLVLLQIHGLSATFAIVPAVPDLLGCIQQADALVKLHRGGARGEGKRGFVIGL